MRRGEFGVWLMIVLCLGFGLVGIDSSYFRDSSICDSTGCHPHAAGTIEPMTFVISGVFFLLGVYLLVRAVRRPTVSASASVETRLEVSAAEQAKVARDARTNYMKPSRKLYNQAAPSEFDRQMLSLLDSIEVGAGDIDAKIETMRFYVRHEGLFQGWRDRFKASQVWQRGAVKLQWIPKTPETWELRCNWNRLQLVVGPAWWSDHTIAAMWFAPEIGQATVETV